MKGKLDTAWENCVTFLPEKTELALFRWADGSCSAEATRIHDQTPQGFTGGFSRETFSMDPVDALNALARVLELMK